MKIAHEGVLRISDEPYIHYVPVPKGQRYNKTIWDAYVSPLDEEWCCYSTYKVGGAWMVCHRNNAPDQYAMMAFNDILPIDRRCPRTVRAFRRWLRKNPSNIAPGTIIEAVLDRGNAERGIRLLVKGRIPANGTTQKRR